MLMILLSFSLTFHTPVCPILQISLAKLIYASLFCQAEENEAVVEYALKKRNVKIVPTGLDVGKAGYVRYRQHRYVGCPTWGLIVLPVVLCER